MPLCSVDSDDLEEDDLVWQHHHYIACKDYDRTIMRKLHSIENLNPVTQSIQQDQLEHIEKNSLKTKRIMLVEDEDDIVLLFKMILESDAGLKVDSFTDPFSALNNFKLGLYDLILIDIALPKMNGFELYKKIRKQVFPELESNCFIRKPITNEDLIQKVKDILKIQYTL